MVFYQVMAGKSHEPKRRFVAGKIIYKRGMFKCHIEWIRMDPDGTFEDFKVGDMTDMIQSSW